MRKLWWSNLHIDCHNIHKICHYPALNINHWRLEVDRSTIWSPSTRRKQSTVLFLLAALWLPAATNSVSTIWLRTTTCLARILAPFLPMPSIVPIVSISVDENTSTVSPLIERYLWTMIFGELAQPNGCWTCSHHTIMKWSSAVRRYFIGTFSLTNWYLPTIWITYRAKISAISGFCTNQIRWAHFRNDGIIELCKLLWILIQTFTAPAAISQLVLDDKLTLNGWLNGIDIDQLVTNTLMKDTTETVIVRNIIFGRSIDRFA